MESRSIESWWMELVARQLTWWLTTIVGQILIKLYHFSLLFLHPNPPTNTYTFQVHKFMVSFHILLFHAYICIYSTYILKLLSLYTINCMSIIMAIWHWITNWFTFLNGSIILLIPALLDAYSYLYRVKTLWALPSLPRHIYCCCPCLVHSF